MLSCDPVMRWQYLMVNNAKGVDKDVKACKAILSEEAFLNKSLDAQIDEWQGKSSKQVEELIKAVEKEKGAKHEQDSQTLESLRKELEGKLQHLEPREKAVEAMVAKGDNLCSEADSKREARKVQQQQLLTKTEEIMAARLAGAEEVLPNPDMVRLNGLVIPEELKNSINASLSMCLHGSFDVFSKTGEEQLKAVKELQESLKILKGYHTGKKFFGGEIIGPVDIVAGWIPSWFRIIKEIIGVKIINEQELPLLCMWIHSILDLDLVKESMPPLDKVKAHMSNIRECAGCSTLYLRLHCRLYPFQSFVILPFKPMILGILNLCLAIVGHVNLATI